jgi:hypothetical protein
MTFTGLPRCFPGVQRGSPLETDQDKREGNNQADYQMCKSLMLQVRPGILFRFHGFRFWWY